mgnify:CR=1 FL=1
MQGPDEDPLLAMSTKPFQLDERRSFRYPMAIVTRLRELGNADVPVVLHNLSTIGFSGECAAPLDAPTVIAISLPPIGELRARVRWSRDGLFGAEFLTRLEEDRLERVLEANPGSIVAARTSVA